jgi:hypothetical protein
LNNVAILNDVALDDLNLNDIAIDDLDLNYIFIDFHLKDHFIEFFYNDIFIKRSHFALVIYLVFDIVILFKYSAYFSNFVSDYYFSNEDMLFWCFSILFIYSSSFSLNLTLIIIIKNVF